MWHEILHAFLDSLKMLPILIIMYLLIELIELKTAKSLKHSKLLKGKYAPLLGSAVGLVPQCGFSVVATDLYTKKAVSVGTLMAVYIATSDEAIPLLISNPSTFKDLWIILLIKFLMAITIGYAVNLYVKYFYKEKVNLNKLKKASYNTTTQVPVTQQNIDKKYLIAQVGFEDDAQVVERGCCGHNIQSNDKLNFWKFVYHPLIHCLKIFLFILVVNIVFALIIYYVGENNLIEFLNKGKYLQPLIAGIVGLIPNCASSVIITRLFILGGLNLGACITGLSVNAGIAYALLIKQNQNKKHTLFIIAGTFIYSLLVGMLIALLGW